VAISTLAVRCRSSVERDGRTREVELVPEAEAPARLALVLLRLLNALRAIGVDEPTAWRLVTKCALDSMPALRRKALSYLRPDGRLQVARVLEDMTMDDAMLRDLAALRGRLAELEARSGLPPDHDHSPQSLDRPRADAPAPPTREEARPLGGQAKLLLRSWRQPYSHSGQPPCG
jgi:hypothetical protein